MRKWQVLLAFLLLAATSCKETPAEVAPSLKSVSVVEKTLALPRGGSAEMHFSVTDAGFRFGGLRDVVLSFPSAGDAAACRLADVRSDSPEGHYIAVLEDTGGDASYSLQLRLGVRTSPGSEAMVLSEPFEVSNGGAPSAGPDTGLPVVRIETSGGKAIVNKVDWIPSKMTIEGTEYACSVRGRGNSTWEWRKKPYAVKLDKKAEVLGMPAHKRWVLLANFVDRTMMRNIVSMKVASLTSLAWTPRCKSVELVLNGVHQGNYLLIEQVKVDKNRVAIDADEGFMLELDFHYDNEIQWMDPNGRCNQFGKGIPFGIKHPDPEDITAEQVAKIKEYVTTVSNVLYGKDFADPVEGYAKYLDVASFIDYWIVFEVMGNHELGNPGSVYMHRDKDGLLTAGPCWDFDWGVLSYKTSPQARTGLINAKAIWYERLFADPAFRSAVKARFNELLPALQEIPVFMEETERELARSAALNFDMWNPAEDASMNGGSIINGDERMSFHDASVQLREVFEERLKVIAKSL